MIRFVDQIPGGSAWSDPRDFYEQHPAGQQALTSWVRRSTLDTRTRSCRNPVLR